MKKLERLVKGAKSYTKNKQGGEKWTIRDSENSYDRKSNIITRKSIKLANETKLSKREHTSKVDPTKLGEPPDEGAAEALETETVVVEINV